MGTQTYELLPVNMTKKSVELISDKIKQVNDYMQRELMLENATYYYVPMAQMSETEFINEIMHKSGAKLLLDVNNVYVNAQNHGFSAHQFLEDLDLSHAAYIHIAGHYEDEDLGLIIDSHGTDVKEEVWNLLSHTLQKIDIPVMIERDNYVPSYRVMQEEYRVLEKVVKNARA